MQMATNGDSMDAEEQPDPLPMPIVTNVSSKAGA